MSLKDENMQGMQHKQQVAKQPIAKNVKAPNCSCVSLKTRFSQQGQDRRVDVSVKDGSKTGGGLEFMMTTLCEFVSITSIFDS